jgi:heme/copper-type cytochrome/quinol oxidase subunit 4
MRMYVIVWLGLLLVVIAEVLLTLGHLSAGTLLASLLLLAVIEAGIAIMYFMHLRYEHRLLFWSLIPALVFVLIMMDHFWPDAVRLKRERVPQQAAQLVPQRLPKQVPAP